MAWYDVWLEKRGPNEKKVKEAEAEASGATPPAQVPPRYVVATYPNKGDAVDLCTRLTNLGATCTVSPAAS